jgi:hypothetical protein
MNTLLKYDLAMEADPCNVPSTLDAIADLYAEAEEQIKSDWSSTPGVGKVWGEYATILRRAAESCRTALKRNGLT